MRLFGSSIGLALAAAASVMFKPISEQGQFTQLARPPKYKSRGGRKNWSLRDNWSKVRANRKANVLRKRRERKRSKGSKLRTDCSYW